MLPTNCKEHPTHKGVYLTEDGRAYSSRLGRFLKLHDNGTGYLKVSIKGKLYYIHRVVAETYLPNPHNLSQVNHLNCDKSDNSVSNLEWCSRADNMRHAVENGRWIGNKHAIGGKIFEVLEKSTGKIFDITDLKEFAISHGIKPGSLHATLKYKTTSLPYQVLRKK